MTNRYDADANRSRGDRSRDEYGRFESESDRRSGRESRRYDTTDYYSGDRNRNDRDDNYGRDWGRYDTQGYDRFNSSDRYGNEDDRSRSGWNDWDDRSSRFSGSSSQMGRGNSGYRSDWDRSRNSSDQGYGEQPYSQQRWNNEGSYQGSGSMGGNYRSQSMGAMNRSSSGMGSSFDRGWDQQSGSRGQFTGRGPKGYRRSDERITEDVNEALSQHPEIDASEIEVKVNNGEVTLSGTVSERHFKRMAEDIAERCSGVHDVRNEIRVQSEHESRSDNQHQQTDNQTQQMKGKPATSSAGNKTAESKTA